MCTGESSKTMSPEYSNPMCKGKSSNNNVTECVLQGGLVPQCVYCTVQGSLLTQCVQESLLTRYSHASNSFPVKSVVLLQILKLPVKPARPRQPIISWSHSHNKTTGPKYPTSSCNFLQWRRLGDQKSQKQFLQCYCCDGEFDCCQGVLEYVQRG